MNRGIILRDCEGLRLSLGHSERSPKARAWADELGTAHKVNRKERIVKEHEEYESPRKVVKHSWRRKSPMEILEIVLVPNIYYISSCKI